MEKKLDLIKKLKEVKKKKRLNNNKGFSLIELLIVIGIMGVLAVIAFNMFGGVLNNSKRRADEQQAQIIQKALLTYCVDSNDWSLNGTFGTSNADICTSGTTKDKQLLSVLMQTITFNDKNYGPMLTPKDPADTDVSENSDNVAAFNPQWNGDVGGKNEGYAIDVYPSQQSVVVKPAETDAACVVKVHTTSTGTGT